MQQSYERQTKALHDHGTPENMIFEDKLTGSTMDRPGLDDLLERARPGDTVIVSSLGRLGRTVPDTLQTFEELEEKGIHVRSVKPGEEFEGITGTLLRNIMLSIAQWERENTKERAAEGRAARAAKGERAPRAKTALTPAKIAAAKSLRDGVTPLLGSRAVSEWAVRASPVRWTPRPHSAETSLIASPILLPVAYPADWVGLGAQFRTHSGSICRISPATENPPLSAARISAM